MIKRIYEWLFPVILTRKETIMSKVKITKGYM